MITYIALVIYLIKAGLNFVIQYWGHIVGVRIQGDMRKEMFEHLQKLPFSFFDENKTGTIMSRLINDLQDISELAHHGPEDIFIATITVFLNIKITYNKKRFLQKFAKSVFICDKVTENIFRLGYTNINENKSDNERT